MHIHFIAIGGAAMHNLAIALHKKGYKITGSDDEIFEPSKSRLKKHGILPPSFGWYPEKIHDKIDAIVLGMHAKEDNPELIKAQELGIKIYSYPSYLYEQSKDKIRIVIGGSHGKTTITSMILHVLQEQNIETDYMVGAQLEGFDTMVKLTSDAKYIVLEGDEYLSSPTNRIPKFHIYKPHIALLSGIAWDHMNVFPTFEIYVEQFRKFIKLIEKNGKLIWCSKDTELQKLTQEDLPSIALQAYNIPDYHIENGTTYIHFKGKEIPLGIFGEHNLMNLEGAKYVCAELGISQEDFYNSISNFKGASKRLELISKNNTTAIYKDFAHSPSKLKASINAVKKQFPKRKLTACIELHTFSSLNKDFLPQYKGSMAEADEAIVYFNPHTLEHKNLPSITKEEITTAFDNKKLIIYNDSAQLRKDLLNKIWENANLLMMSSGNYDGIDFADFAVITKK